MRRKQIGLWPAALCTSRQWLWRALEELFPVSLVPFEAGAATLWDALIVSSSDQEPSWLALLPKVPVLLSIGGLEPRKSTDAADPITLKHHSAIPPVFRGRTLTDGLLSDLLPVAVAAGDEVVACQENRPVWTYRPARADLAARDVVSLSFPILSAGACLRECCHGGNFLEALPLLGFLQRLTATESWLPAPQRACFIFDDPSLRWPSYGFVNYVQLARHAQACNYHAAIGFIPLDAAWVNADVARVIQSNPAYLSLVIHGCNHLRLEMARPYSPPERLALCAQALRRVGQLEREHLLKVCRVMEAPFGVIDQAMFAALLALGYEAVLITTSQFLRHHPDVQFARSFGRQAARPLAGGLGMIPRITVKPFWQIEAMLAACLGQPIVIAGHHREAANRLEALEEIAQTVNGFGEVRWASITEIARANYITRLAGDTLSVSLGARQIVLPIPEGVRQVCIHRPWMADHTVEPLILRNRHQAARAFPLTPRISAPLPVLGADTLEINSPVTNAVNPYAVPAPRPRLWPYVRRALTEARDRALPLIRVGVKSQNPGAAGSPHLQFRLR